MKRETFYGFCVAAILAVISMSIAFGQEDANKTSSGIHGHGVTPYRFERINEHNFDSQGWREQEVNLIPALGTQFSDESEHLSIVCGPDDDSDPRLIRGSVTMNLPTSAFPTLRRIRLRRAGYSGTYLSDLTELKYSTYLVQGAPAAMVLQVDVNGDEAKDFNIFFAPEVQGANPPVAFDIWQQWDALHGRWGIEAATIPGLPAQVTIDQLVVLHPSARIIDTEPVGNNGEGVRFTVGPPALYPNNV
ncbi:MAG: hypothetical protein ABL984_07195, partial [Pyrinomonadaceae bacterium]